VEEERWRKCWWQRRNIFIELLVGLFVVQQFGFQ
jgi:hypothetical protein